MKVFNWILAGCWAFLAVSAFAGWSDPSPVAYGMADVCLALDCVMDALR